MDELLDFAAAIIQSVYGWAIVTGRSDWIGEEVQLQDGGVTFSVK